MQVLLKFNNLRRVPNGTPEDQAKAAFEIVNSAFNDAVNDEETYLYDPETDYAETLDIADGTKDPDKIIDIAKHWNNNIQQLFEDAILPVLAQCPKDETGQNQWLKVPNQTIYELKRAVCALDNSFYQFADMALLVKPYFTTILQPDELRDILQNPTDYVCIDVSPE